MVIVNFFTDRDAWENEDLFFPLRRFFGPFKDNPFDGRSNADIKVAFLKAIHADPLCSFDERKIAELEKQLDFEALRFVQDFGTLLPPGFKILLFPISSSWEFVMKHLGGTWGVTFPNCIVLAAHPEAETSRLKRTLHHEMNHSVRLKFIDDDHHFLDRIVLEGLAEAYVDEQFPKDLPSKFATAVDESTVAEWLPKLREFWLNDDARFENYKDYVYGSEVKNIPRWLGYSVGYQIVKSYRREHPNETWADLIQRPAKDFLTKHWVSEKYRSGSMIPARGPRNLL